MLYQDKDQIIAWLERYRIKNYTLRPDDIYGYRVDVEANVSLFKKDLNHIAVKFGVVSGGFDCSHNELTSLKGCPDKVGGDFWCNNNQLTSLEHAPQIVGLKFACNNNLLTSLKGATPIINAGFNCDSNKLTSLIGGPVYVERFFTCVNNSLVSLEGLPEEVKSFFVCCDNPALGELQDFKTFAELKVYMLSQKLSDDLNDSGKKVKKIKL